MRILHILDHSLPLQSGYVFRTLGLLSGQREQGWQTLHLTSPRQGKGQQDDHFEEVDGWSFFRTPVPLGGGIAGYFNDMKALKKRLHEVIKETVPDILHVHSPVLNVLPALKVARYHKIPIVYEIRAFWEDAAVDHGSTAEGSLRYKVTRFLETYACRKVDHIFTICEGLAGDLKGRGLSESKITVIPNAIQIPEIERPMMSDSEIRTRYHLDGKTVLGFVGSFYAYEGLETLVQAMPALCKMYPDLRVLFVGGGPREQALKEQIEQLGLKDYVLMVGRVPHGDVQRYYRVCDGMIFPRRSMRLTELVTPLKPLETMGYQKTVIASDIGGHRELITSGKTGFLLDMTTPEILAESLGALLLKRAEWEGVAIAGFEYVKKERNWNAVALRYKAVYEGLF